MLSVVEALNLLGHTAEDRVTNLSGVITSISFDLYGCMQALVTPAVDKDGSLPTSYWLDIDRLYITSKRPVLEPPVFDLQPLTKSPDTLSKGPQEKPSKV